MKRIVIAEDNKFCRQSLKRLLVDFEIVCEAETGNEVLPLIQKTIPDLLILDLSLPSKSGISIVRDLKESYPNLKILILSIHDSELFIKEAIHAGADGYCLKDEGRKNILTAIETILEGQDYLSPSLRNSKPSESPSRRSVA